MFYWWDNIVILIGNVAIKLWLLLRLYVWYVEYWLCFCCTEIFDVFTVIACFVCSMQSSVLIIDRARCEGPVNSSEFILRFWHQLGNEYSQWPAVTDIRHDCGQHSTAFATINWTTLQCTLSVNAVAEKSFYALSWMRNTEVTGWCHLPLSEEKR